MDNLQENLNTRLRVTKKRSEIIEVLCELQQSVAQIKVWQNNQGGRKTNDVIIISVNSVSDTFLIQSKDNVGFSSFTDDVCLYFTTAHKSILLKTSIVSILPNAVVVSVPKELKIHEKRDRLRLHFKTSKMPIISFKRPILYGKSEKIWDEQIFDISSNGSAICVRSDRRDLFKVDAKLKIDKIAETKVDPSDLYAKVTYSKQVILSIKQRKQVFYRVGLIFNRRIELAEYFM
ncbi:MAG: hypothetical protein ISR65_05620 [Bacteriovoracaceae bacterium]|nr:hypothetical protein [Bacteriovoracaceae bacterium]